MPVSIDRESDRGRYVEPNVWMHHRLQGAAGENVRNERPPSS
jgi:hypothetical protein